MVLSTSFVLILLNNYMIIVQVEAGIYKTIITANYIQVYVYSKIFQYAQQII